jgi:hypothetical protein
MKSSLFLLLVTVLAFGCSMLSYAQENEKNNVIMGRGYEKNQKSEKELIFMAPAGWSEDREAAKKLGLVRVLVPNGTTLEQANKVITIAFQRKDLDKPGLDNLENFFRGDLRNTLSKFPDAELSRWQPSKLNQDKVKFFSGEIYGKQKDEPSPQHFVVLDAGDGYFSVALTAETRNELQLQTYEDFFNSLSLNERK